MTFTQILPSEKSGMAERYWKSKSEKNVLQNTHINNSKLAPYKSMDSQFALNPLPTFYEWYETTNSIGKCRCQLLQMVFIHTSLSKCLQFILCFPQPTIGQTPL